MGKTQKEAIGHDHLSHSLHSPRSLAESQKHPVARNHRQLPPPPAESPTSDNSENHGPFHTSLSFGGERRASPYVALTPQVLQQHNREYIHIDQGKRLEAGVNSLRIHAGHPIHTKLCDGSIDMAPMERFQASATYPQHFMLYEVPPLQQSGTYPQVPSQEYIDGVSTIVANHGSEDMSYAQNSADRVVSVPDPQCYGSPSAYGYAIADRRMDLAGAGTQFD